MPDWICGKCLLQGSSKCPWRRSMFTSSKANSRTDNMVLNLSTSLEVEPMEGKKLLAKIQIEFSDWDDLKYKVTQHACTHDWMLTDRNDHCLFGSEHQHSIYEAE